MGVELQPSDFIVYFCATFLHVISFYVKIKKGKEIMPGVCPRCSKNVYFAEEKQALGKSWHKLCFVCANCKKLLDSGRITEHDGEMYCGSCYGKFFGPKGYGFGGGAGTLSMDDGKGYQVQIPHFTTPKTQ